MTTFLLLILLAAFAGGSVPPFAKIALEQFQPLTLVFLRFLSASLVLLPFVWRRGELNLNSLRELFWVAAIGALNPILLFIALQFTPSSVSPLIYAAVPLLTAAYLFVVRHVKVAGRKLAGILIGFTGVAIIILLPFLQTGAADLKSFGGNLLIFGAAVAFMFYGMISNEKQRQLHISPLAITFYFCLITLMLSVPFAAYEVASRPVDLAAVKPKHFLSALEVGLVGTSLFYLSYQEALARGDELTASLFTYLQPIATILLAVLMLGEKITAPFVLGGALAVVGAQLAAKNR